MSETKTVDEDGLARSSTHDHALREDDTTIPSGQLDPVYERKANVLNRAVCP